MSSLELGENSPKCRLVSMTRRHMLLASFPLPPSLSHSLLLIIHYLLYLYLYLVRRCCCQAARLMENIYFERLTEALQAIDTIDTHTLYTPFSSAGYIDTDIEKGVSY